MRHSSLCLAAVFLLSSLMVAQHSSGSSGGSSSSGGGGGSHSGSSGGSSSAASSGGGGGHTFGGGGNSGGGHSPSSGANSSAGGGHSSASGGHNSGSGSRTSMGGASAPHSGAHGTSTRVSEPFATSRHEQSGIRSGAIHGTREPRLNLQAHPALPERRGFFSFLRHPFRHPDRKAPPSGDLRHPVCIKGPCQVCSNGQVATKGGCVAVTFQQQQQDYCSNLGFWNGNCTPQTHFLADCSALRMSVQSQAQRLQTAVAIEQSACAAGPTPECASASNARMSEENLYRSLQARYQQCMRLSIGSYSLGGYTNYGYRSGFLMDRLTVE